MGSQIFLTYQDVLFIALLLCLTVSTITDLSSRQIPNFITFGLILVAFVSHFILSGWTGLFFSFKGLTCGLTLLLIPYLLGGMGAGDVKLLAAVGAVLGATHIFYTFIIITLTGGCVAIIMLLVRKDFLPAMKRIGQALIALIGGVGATALRIAPTTLKQQGIPYASVITASTLIYITYNLISGKGLPLY